MLQIYDKLLELPLFIGIGSGDLSEIVDTTKFDFHKLERGTALVKDNDKCSVLYFLMDGRMKVESRADDNSYSIEEEVAAPAVIQPERLFGLMHYHSKTYTAKTDCNLLSIDKNEVLKLSDNYLIFRLNFFNIISTQAQRGSRVPWQRQPEDIREKFFGFLKMRCITPAGPKTVHIKMQDLANEIHESRLNVSRMLNGLQAEGLITLARSLIHIPLLEKLR